MGKWLSLSADTCIFKAKQYQFVTFKTVWHLFYKKDTEWPYVDKKQFYSSFSLKKGFLMYCPSLNQVETFWYVTTKEKKQSGGTFGKKAL